MDCWHILQIAPTSDERAIKRAYAKLLKTTRPDDDAEGYQRLREAFDEALAIAPYIESETAPEWSFQASERLPENERSEFRQNERSEFRQNEQSEFRQNEQSEFRQNEQSEFRQNERSGFGQADSHHTLPPWQASNPDEHHTYRFSGSPKPDTTENEKLPENENPPEAFVYPFDPDIGATFSGSPNPYGGDPCAALLDDIEARFERGGAPELEAAWPHIRERLEQLPLGETENASYQLADFLRTHKINDCMLWAQWSDYFGWHRPDIRNNIFTPAELEQIKEYRRIAARLAKHRAQTQHTQTFVPPIGQTTAQLLAYWRQWFKQGGSEELLRRWPETSRMLDNVPPQERSDVAAACLDFLHHNQIRHPLLWAHLADYPGWPHAFFQEVRDPEGLARLEEYRRTAGIIRLFEPEAAGPDEDGGKPEERLPVSALFARFLGTQPGLMRRLFATFAAMLLWPELSGEANRRQRWLLHTYRPAVHKRYDFWHGCRIAWVAVCFLIAIVSGIVVAVDAGWDKGFALTAAVFITFIVTAMSYGIYIMCASFLLVLLRLLWPSMEGRLVRFKHYSPWGKALYLLAFPITVALMLPASLDVPLWHGSVLAYMLSLTYYSTYDRDGSFAVKDASAWFKACLCMTGVLGLPITFPILQGYPQYLLAASLLWLNANLYLLFDRPGWLEKIEKPIRQLLAGQIGRKPWQWLLLPFRAAYAALLWLLLLPAQAARLGTSKEDSAWEIATGTLLLLALLPRELSAYVLLLIYPAAMLSALLRHIVQRLLLRGLRRGAGKTQAT